MNANANNQMGRLRAMVAEHPDRGQHGGWSARLRMIGWRPTSRTATPPAKTIKARRRSKSSGSGGRGGRH